MFLIVLLKFLTEYPLYMFRSKNKKNKHTPVNYTYIKLEYKGVYITRTCHRHVRLMEWVAFHQR